MRSFKKSIMIWLLSFCCLQLAGCQQYLTFAKYTMDDRLNGDNYLVAKSSPVVTTSAYVGMLAGLLAAFPVQLPYSFCSGIYETIKEYRADAKSGVLREKILHPSENGLESGQDAINRTLRGDRLYIEYAPAVVGVAIGQNAVGWPMWLLFGW